MKKARKWSVRTFLKGEKGYAELIEAAIIYPVVFLFLAFLIYIGLYIMQSMTVSSYAEKVALLAAREVAHPGYLEMFQDGENVFNNASVEADAANGMPTITIKTDANGLDTRAYRYWGNPLTDDSSKAYENILTEMVKNNSILSAGDVEATVQCENVILTQYINVTIEQKLMNFAVLEFFGIESPTIICQAKATVSDTDEFIRNIDFGCDGIKWVANKCGIDVSKLTEIKEKLKEIKTTFGL